MKAKEQTKTSCFLKTKNLRFKEFIITLEGSVINFSRHTGELDEVKVRHKTDIMKSHVRLGPMETDQNAQ